MANLIDYIHKYGHVSFSRKKFNDLDNVVFSYLSYLNYADTCAVENGHTLQEILTDFLSKHRFRDSLRRGLGERDAYKLAVEVKDMPRYAKITVKDYMYVMDSDTQFGVMTFNITRRLAFISFEGTDHSLGGWKEDCLLACSYPVDSHKLGIEYLRKHIKMTGPRVIVGGHSKGGNTALVSAMAMKGWRQKKIRAVYSNDGPGLRKREIESEAYKAIRPKFKHIVPHCSIVGMLLRHDTHFVVKSNQRGIFAHLPLTWEVMDDKFRRSVLTAQSQAINKSLVGWLDQHDDATRLKIVNDTFDALYAAGMDTTMDLRNAKKLFALLKDLKKFDKETRDLALSLAKYSYDNIVSATKKDANLT